MGKPNIEQLKNKKDVKGLIQAVYYGEERNKQYKASKDNFQALQQEVSPIVLGAALALSEIGDPRGIVPIIDNLIKDPFSLGSWRYTENPYNFASVVVSRFGEAGVVPLLEELKRWKRGQPDTNWIDMALGWIGDQRATMPLIEKFCKKPTIWALGHIGSNEATTFLINLLLGKNIREIYPNPIPDEEREVRRLMDSVIIAFRSGKFDHNKEIGDELTLALRENPPSVRRIALILCEIGDARGLEATDHFRPGTDYFSIAKCSDDRARQFLVSKVEKYTDSSLRTAKDISDCGAVYFAALALARMGDVRAIKPLVDVFANSKARAERDRVSLTDLTETYLYPGIINSYYHVATRALIQLGVVALEPLSSYFADPNSAVAYEATDIYNKIINRNM